MAQRHGNVVSTPVSDNFFKFLKDKVRKTYRSHRSQDLSSVFLNQILRNIIYFLLEYASERYQASLDMIYMGRGWNSKRVYEMLLTSGVDN